MSANGAVMLPEAAEPDLPDEQAKVVPLTQLVPKRHHPKAESKSSIDLARMESRMNIGTAVSKRGVDDYVIGNCTEASEALLESLRVNQDLLKSDGVDAKTKARISINVQKLTEALAKQQGILIKTNERVKAQEKKRSNSFAPGQKVTIHTHNAQVNLHDQTSTPKALPNGDSQKLLTKG